VLPGRRYPVSSLSSGHGLFLGVRSPYVWLFDVVLSVRVPVRPNLIWRSSPLPGHAYPVSELSWQFMRVPLVEVLHQAVMG
jgi:hypothetical protein